ncbi:MAG: penicillin-binding protein 2 [Candidatus Omnitrophica bacterium]|nr:penicillin-binding protein 2 [Candidatus Omnitrophota bacterium]
MRIGLLKRIFIVLILMLFASLAYNQLIKGPDYLQLSQNNRIKLIRLDAPRGLIYDRNGELVAGLRLVFNVALFPQEVEDIQKALQAISPLVGLSKESLMAQYKNNFSAPFIPVVIAQDVPKETAIILECQESNIPGLVIQTQSLRDYIYGETLSHVLGYLGKITEEELKKFKVYGLWDKNLLGRSGVEQVYDSLLRGQVGGMQVEVNNRGHRVRMLGVRYPQSGEDLYLTIDIHLQKLVDELLSGKKGVCIVMDPQNGEILSMVSKPSFDPNQFILALNGNPGARRIIAKLLNSQDAALINRAISATYPPGSIFKIVVAACGLETGEIDSRSTVHCSGSIRVGKRDLHCWKLDGHGDEDIYSALGHSCNVFFYRLALELGPDKLSMFAHKFGLGSLTAIDLPFESDGLVPSKSWKIKTKKEKWYDGETANFAIGQGYLLTTPLQMARLISAVANGGYLIQPHVVRRAGARVTKNTSLTMAFKDFTWRTIREGMRMVVQDEEGTGHRAYIPGCQWAAKTGTAQTFQGMAHGWFGGFYPYDQPRIAILVFLEHGGSGGDAPASIAKEVIQYLRKNKEL